MGDAIRYLLEDAQRYMFIINRSPINPENGETQDESITLSEKDPLSLGNVFDARLRHSRQIIIVLIQQDGGVAKIDLTARKWEVWVRSATLPAKIRTFNKKLRSAGHSRLFTTDAVLLLASFPFWSFVLLFTVWSILNRKARHEIYSKSKTSPSIPPPEWLLHYGSAIVNLWPLILLVAAGIWIIILTSGGLRIWPKYLSRHSLQRAIYEIRANFALPQNLNAPLFVAVVAAIFGALITYLLTRYLG